MTGPTPKIPVVVVPDALTATASLFLVSRIWVPVRRRSSRNPAASSQRARATASDGLTDSRTLAVRRLTRRSWAGEAHLPPRSKVPLPSAVGPRPATASQARSPVIGRVGRPAPDTRSAGIAGLTRVAEFPAPVIAAAVEHQGPSILQQVQPPDTADGDEWSPAACSDSITQSIYPSTPSRMG